MSKKSIYRIFQACFFAMLTWNANSQEALNARDGFSFPRSTSSEQQLRELVRKDFGEYISKIDAININKKIRALLVNYNVGSGRPVILAGIYLCLANEECVLYAYFPEPGGALSMRAGKGGRIDLLDEYGAFKFTIQNYLPKDMKY